MKNDNIPLTKGGKEIADKPWPAASNDPKDSAMIGGVANGRPLTRTAPKGK